MHQPVMLDEVISSLNLKPGARALDATIGGGGHAIEILKRIEPGGILIGIDADASAVAIASESLRGHGSSVMIERSNFRQLDEVLSKHSIESLDAALFDIGVSSFQLDDPSRGFSVRQDGPLDMRMDSNLGSSARDIVNRCREEELSDIIRDLGEERYHRKIASRIVEARSKKPIQTTGELKEVIYRALGPRRGYMRIDPATRTFQAIRIAVNDELGALEEGIRKAIDRLKPGGRISVISFHSLEDRIVKNVFRNNAAVGIVKIITKKPLRPSDRETAANPRARSARLRTAERCGDI